MTENNTTYHRYAYDDMYVTAGRDAQDQIRICQRGIGRFRIDRRQRKIEIIAAGTAVYCDGKQIKGQSDYRSGSVLLCGPLKMVLHDVFLMIRDDPAVIVHLSEADTRADLVLRFAPLRTKRIPPQLIAQIPADTIRIRVPKKTAAEIAEPSFLSYLPALLMSAAGLVSTVFAASANPQTPVSAWIMPICMLVIHALLFPLRRIAWKSEVRRKEKQERERITEERNNCLAEIEEFAAGFRQKMDMVFPTPGQLCTQLEDGTAGYRDLRSPAFGKIRLGDTDGFIHIDLEVENEPDTESFRILALRSGEVQRIAGPWVIDLNVTQTVRICYTEMQKLYFRYILLQAAVYLRSTEHAFVFAFPDHELMDSVRDLPHVMCASGIRYLVKDVRDALEAVRELQKETRRVVLFAEARMSVYFSELPAIRIILDEKGYEYTGQTDLDLTVDSFAATAADHLCGRERFFFCDVSSEIIPYSERLFAGLSCTGCRPPYPAYPELLREAGIDLKDIRKNWKRDPDRSIKALIGCTEDREPVFLDLHENADGPHGLLAGTTGSGKSELLITMILSLAMQYAPWDLQFVIIDFKGGASVQAFEGKNGKLPHLSCSLTDLDVTDMKRAVAALQAECRWREQCFRKLHAYSGRPVTSIGRYRSLQKQYRSLPQLAHLIIIVDEYAELKQSDPQFPDELVRIARIGRSLGMHLLLCTQKPSGTVNDQIRSNTAYKICLKTADRQDSMEVIRKTDAAYLEGSGSFYLVTDQKYIQGKACYSREAMNENRPRVQLFDSMHRIKADSVTVTGNESTVLEVLRERITKSAEGYHAQSIWQVRPRNPSLQLLAKTKGAFALADDTVRRRIIPLTLTEGCGHLFFTADRKAKQNGIYAVLWALIKDSGEADQLYVMDDLYMGLEILNEESLGRIEVFPSSATDQLCEAAKKIRSRKHDAQNRCALIITDCTRFYEAPGASDLLLDVLEHGQDHNVNTIIFAPGCGSVHFRDMSRISDRYYLASDHLNDMSSVMETVIRVPVKGWDEGLCRRGELMEFYLPHVTAEQLRKTLPAFGRGNTNGEKGSTAVSERCRNG